METERIRAVLVEFVRGVDGVAEPVSTSASFDDLGVDSMSTMDLLVKVEKEFGVEVPDEQLPMIVSIQDLVDFVAKHVIASFLGDDMPVFDGRSASSAQQEVIR